ncbi:MAG: riboflavin synthase [Parcubacteria group bacterium Athens0416_74]|nr:MAG: riboflavin synthase [Parcubacteria group bacterium Athens0416_74]
MFAGIIEKKTRVLETEKKGRILRVRVEKPRTWKLVLGQSINIDGVCSTVVRTSAAFFDVEYMPETLSKTAAGSLTKGQVVNLERSLKYGQRIDGHPVQGHVDASTPVRELRALGKSKEITIKPSALLAGQAVLHGSIALNGVSLTIARKHGPNVTLALIPHTLSSTNLGLLTVGDVVNVEFDHSASYLAGLRKK